MLEPLKRLAKKTMRLNSDAMLKRVLKEPSMQALIVDLNTEEQLYKRGIGADGESIGRYHPITVSFYKPLAATQGRDGRTENVTLKDTGAFYKTFRVKRIDGGIVITAKDVYELAYKYGKDILGLTDESIQEILPEIRARIGELVRLALAA